MTFICFWVHWFAAPARKAAKDQVTKFDQLTGRDLRQGAKIILKLLFLTRREVL